MLRPPHPSAPRCGGCGGRELGKPDKPDADTLYIIASNTKALTTLLLAKLVDEHRLPRDTPVTRVMPSFKLGDAAITRSVLIKHLICACTELPRQDLEWLTESHRLTPRARADVARHGTADQCVRRAVPVLEPEGRRGRLRRGASPYRQPTTPPGSLPATPAPRSAISTSHATATRSCSTSAILTARRGDRRRGPDLAPT